MNKVKLWVLISAPLALVLGLGWLLFCWHSYQTIVVTERKLYENRIEKAAHMAEEYLSHSFIEQRHRLDDSHLVVIQERVNFWKKLFDLEHLDVILFNSDDGSINFSNVAAYNFSPNVFIENPHMATAPNSQLFIKKGHAESLTENPNIPTRLRIVNHNLLLYAVPIYDENYILSGMTVASIKFTGTIYQRYFFRAIALLFFVTLLCLGIGYTIFGWLRTFWKLLRDNIHDLAKHAPLKAIPQHYHHICELHTLANEVAIANATIKTLKSRGDSHNSSELNAIRVMQALRKYSFFEAAYQAPEFLRVLACTVHPESKLGMQLTFEHISETTWIARYHQASTEGVAAFFQLISTTNNWGDEIVWDTRRMVVKTDVGARIFHLERAHDRFLPLKETGATYAKNDLIIFFNTACMPLLNQGYIDQLQTLMNHYEESNLEGLARIIERSLWFQVQSHATVTNAAFIVFQVK